MRTKVGIFLCACAVLVGAAVGGFSQTQAAKFDEYGKIKAADEGARLDNFAIQLQSDPGSSAYVIYYCGRICAKGESKAASVRIKKYLTTKRGIDASRVVMMDGGYKEEANFELWTVAGGASPPMASPTVDPSEVKPPKAKKAASKKSKKH